MKGKRLWVTGLALAAGVILADKLLHGLPSWLAITMFIGAWTMIIAGMWKEKVKKNAER